MKIFLSLTLIVLFSPIIFSQTEPNKEVRLSLADMKARIIKQEFPDVPESVRRFHAKGSIFLFVSVDEQGKVKSAKLFSKFFASLKEYLEKAAANWEFKPLKVDEKQVSFRGVIVITFCYGNFSDCY